ncbi:MAG: Fur family transcriptional regulator [Pseudomonadota bacterium]|jgi:Fur family ferric uptake transcriptional regulator|nr:transcriptional repressor [Alphaproteobacteria bacterium]MEC7702270.1 Fur family transcriptional regulator [Pseudomonadota bacterium]MEC9236455.1 Fur family transcriptional regulator [Pseudomonadota bacterium]MED5421918.1 Fur family transcriptional regulator [Pseudomonadota bacterium]|tara:strand:- start:365 stop:772 length:408 start_codon:yes stop_codon:yes gene_type:complete
MDFQRELKSLNLSLTPVRLAVLEGLMHKPHSEAALLFEIVQEKIQTTSIQAVYNNLNTLVERGLVREIKPKGMPSIYEIRKDDNHHHLVCRGCGNIQDTDCHDVAPCLAPSNAQGFRVDETEIIFWGLCPKCKTS